MSKPWKMPKHRSKKTKISDDLVSRLIAAEEKATRLEAAIGVAMSYLPNDPERAHDVLRLGLEEPPPWVG